MPSLQPCHAAAALHRHLPEMPLVISFSLAMIACHHDNNDTGDSIISPTPQASAMPPLRYASISAAISYAIFTPHSRHTITPPSFHTPPSPYYCRILRRSSALFHTPPSLSHAIVFYAPFIVVTPCRAMTAARQLLRWPCRYHAMPVCCRHAATPQ